MTSTNNITFLKLTDNITLCNGDSRWYISDKFELKINNFHKDKKSSDKEIISLFLQLFAKQQSLPEAKRTEIYENIKKFISKSDIAAIEQKKFLATIESHLVSQLYAQSPTIACLCDCLKSVKSGKALRNADLWKALSGLAFLYKERATLRTLFWMVFVECFNLVLKDHIYSLGAKPIQGYELFSYAYKFDEISAEEIAVISLLGDYLIQPTAEFSKLQQQLQHILHQDPSFSKFVAVKIAKYQLAAYKLTCLKDQACIMNKEIPLPTGEKSKTLQIGLVNTSSDGTWEEQQRKIVEDLHREAGQEDLIANFYAYAYQILKEQCTQKTKSKITDLKTTDGYILPTPAQFQAVHIPLVSYEKLMECARASAASFADLAVNSAPLESWKRFASYVFKPEEYEWIDEAYCRFANIPMRAKETSVSTTDQEQLIEHVAACTLTEKPKNRRKDTSISSQSSQSNIDEEESSDEKVAQPRQTAAISSTRYPPIPMAPRVLVWRKNSPPALQTENYSHLSFAEKEWEILFHTYPITIAHWLKQYTHPRSRQEPITKKVSTLYSTPGFIEYKGKRITGYFADCFDKETLYHHYFHQRQFATLIEQHGTIDAFLDEQALSSVEQDDEGEAEDVEIQGKFEIRKKKFSIEMIHSELGIKYSVCFPDGVFD